jgi:uncharacterized protein (DUF302 family)
MRFAAKEHGMAALGELALSRDIEARAGEDYRLVKTYLFCNPVTAAKMMDYSDAYSAYLPCRITLLEDRRGKLWLIAPDMDLMIHGGAPLPPDLRSETLRVKAVILDIMHRGAAGRF